MIIEFVVWESKNGNMADKKRSYQLFAIQMFPDWECGARPLAGGQGCKCGFEGH